MPFDFEFTEGGDEVFCCYTVPYCYTEIMIHINELKFLNKFSEYKLIRFESIGYSLGGLDIPLLKISNPESFQDPSRSSIFPRNKPVILIIGR